MEPQRNRWLFHFARINLLGLGADGDKWAYLSRAIGSTDIVAYSRHRFAFQNVTEMSVTREIDSPIARYLGGWIVKFAEEKNVPAFREQDHTIHDTAVPGAVITSAPFFVYIGEEAFVAFHPQRHAMTPHEFRTVFCRLTETANSDSFISVDLKSMFSDLTVVDAIKRLDVISKMKIILHPTNPSADPFTRPIDEHIKRLNATRYEVSASTVDPKGLNKQLLETSEFGQGARLASEGYGTARIEGKEGGNDRIVTTETERTAVGKAVTWTGNLAAALQQLVTVFTGLARRKDGDKHDEDS